MTLYEVLIKVSQALSSDLDIQKQISYYLLNSMDDDGEFTRSRYQKRPEQDPLSNRELGNIKYILCGCTKQFHPNQIQYTKEMFTGLHCIVEFKAEIIWNKYIQNLEEDKELLIQSGYEYITTIIL